MGALGAVAGLGCCPAKPWGREEGLCPTLIGLWPGSGRSLRCSLCAVLWSSRVVQILDALDPKPLPRISHYPDKPATSSANPSLRHPFPFTLQGARKGAVSSSPFLFSSTQKHRSEAEKFPVKQQPISFPLVYRYVFFLSLLSHLRHLTAAGTVCLPRRRLASSASLFVSVLLSFPRRLGRNIQLLDCTSIHTRLRLRLRLSNMILQPRNRRTRSPISLRWQSKRQ
ncbi:hypothetical protein B0H13DRAFT_922202 [Mycena leptocephala]|nr:hypothetical protein B0H13DRAFT_922202 [Mycena leptocephala]